MVRRFVLVLALLVGGLGFIVSRPLILRWLSEQSPITAFFLWYVLFFAYIQVVSLVLFRRLDMRSLEAGLGIVLIVFALGIVLYWPASDYALRVVGGSESAPSFLLATEDQITFQFWSSVLPGLGNDVLGVLTYAVTPALLILLASFFIAPSRFRQAVWHVLRGA